MAWRLKVKGLPEVRGRLLELAARGQDQLPVWRAIGDDLAVDSESRIVRAGLVQTGTLAHAQRVTPRGLGVRVSIDGSRAPYARWLQYGKRIHKKVKLVALDKKAKLRALDRLLRWLMVPWEGRR